MVDVPDSGMVVTATQVSGVNYSIDSTYDDIKSALSQGKTVVVMTNGVPQPYVGNVQLDNAWFLAFGVSTIYDNVATLTGFMIPQTYQNVAIWTQQNTTIPELNDVQINGTSIVTDGVANIHVANASTLGMVMSWPNGGTRAEDGKIGIYPAQSSAIKNGTATYQPIVPNTQHQSVFYGLAKASGDTTQSQSSNAVGQYTEDAKIAIQKMLGIYQAPWELIREDTFTNAEASEYAISTDDNGEAFELTELVFLFETPKQNTESALGSYGSIYAHFNRGSAKKVECVQYTQAANASAHGCGMIIKRDGNLIEMSRLQNNAVGNTMNVGYRYGESFPDIAATSDRVSYALDDDSYIWKIRIASVLGTGHYKLYGRRKWQ